MSDVIVVVLVGDKEGEMREGASLRLQVAGTDRIVTPGVPGVVPNERVTWNGGVRADIRGVRTIALRRRQDDSTDFSIDERFCGPIMPLVNGSRPDFGPMPNLLRNVLAAASGLRPPAVAHRKHWTA